MAKAGTQKQWSIDQENSVARWLGGTRTKNSGATDRQKGDVASEDYLVECKFAGSPVKPARSISLKLEDYHKIRDEAAQEGRVPLMHVRFIAHDSPWADDNGFVDAYVVPAQHLHALLES